VPAYAMTFQCQDAYDTGQRAGKVSLAISNQFEQLRRDVASGKRQRSVELNKKLIDMDDRMLEAMESTIISMKYLKDHSCMPGHEAEIDAQLAVAQRSVDDLTKERKQINHDAKMGSRKY
jgi:hypothetical protein